MAKRILAAAVAVLVGLLFITGSPSGDGPGLERTGYFKDDERFRVMAFRAGEPLDRGAAEAALANVMHSDGATTWAVVYGPGAQEPGPALTTAGSRAAALDLIMSPPFDGWDWYLTIRHDGQRMLAPR
jgi:hypothetical protein